MKGSFKAFRKISVYDATCEQVHAFRYLTSLGENQHHQIIRMEKILRNPNIKAIEKSFEILIRRHESLRSYFQVNRGGIKQCIIPYHKNMFPISYFNIGDGDNRESLINNILTECEDNLRSINIPPLFKCLIFNIDYNKSYFFLLIHHIISDEWSLRIIQNELTLYYSSIAEGKYVRILPLKMQISDYSIYQKKWLEKNMNRIRYFWLNKLECILKYNNNEEINYVKDVIDVGIKETKKKKEVLNILNNTKSYSYVSYIEFDLYTCLKIAASNCKISMCTILITSLQLLFTILFNKDRILLPMPIRNRRLRGTEDIIGCLMGGIYLFNHVRQELSYKSFANAVYSDFIKSALFPILDHKEMGLTEEILRLHSDVWLNFISKKAGESFKLYTKIINKNHLAMKDPEFYALSCTIFEYENGMLFNWKYNPCLYSSILIDRMAAVHVKILESISQNPEITIKDMMDDIRKSKTLPLQ
jgi:hypothetical protein